MTAKKPKLGDTVLVAVDPRSNFGSSEAPATIININDEDSDNILINAKVFLDSDEIRNVRGLQLLSKKPSGDDEDQPDGPYAYWPSGR